MGSQRWCRLYDEAFLELNLTKLEEHIEAAQLAIQEREIELRSADAPIEELLMIFDARRTLENLRRNELKPPNPLAMRRSA